MLAAGPRDAAAGAPAGAHSYTEPVTCCCAAASDLPSASADASANSSTPTPLIAEAWGLKEAMRAVYAAQDTTSAQRALERFFTAVDHSELTPFQSFAKGITPWREEILAY
jgi:Transposase